MAIHTCHDACVCVYVCVIGRLYLLLVVSEWIFPGLTPSNVLLVVCNYYMLC